MNLYLFQKLTLMMKHYSLATFIPHHQNVTLVPSISLFKAKPLGLKCEFCHSDIIHPHVKRCDVLDEQE